MDDGYFLFFNKTQWGRILTAIGIGVIGLILRINIAYTGPVEYDEPVYVEAAQRYSNAMRSGKWSNILTLEYNNEHPVFYKLIYGLAVGKAPTGGISMPFDVEIWKLKDFHKLFNLRLTSAFLGSCTVFILSLISPLAGLMLAVNTFAVKYTGVIYLEALPSFLSLASVISFSKFLKEDNTRPLSWLWLTLSAATLGITAASKYVYALPGLALGLYYLYFSLRHSPKKLFALLSWAGLIILFFFLADPILWNNPLGHLANSLGFNLNYSQNDAIVNTKGYPFWQPLVWLSFSLPLQDTTLSPFFLRPNNFWIAIDTLFLPLAVIGLKPLFKQKPIYFLWLLIGLVFLFIWKTKWPQYILIILPPYCLSATLGIDVIRSAWKRFTPPIWRKLGLS